MREEPAPIRGFQGPAATIPKSENRLACRDRPRVLVSVPVAPAALRQGHTASGIPRGSFVTPSSAARDHREGHERFAGVHPPAQISAAGTASWSALVTRLARLR